MGHNPGSENVSVAFVNEENVGLMVTSGDPDPFVTGLPSLEDFGREPPSSEFDFLQVPPCEEDFGLGKGCREPSGQEGPIEVIPRAFDGSSYPAAGQEASRNRTLTHHSQELVEPDPRRGRPRNRKNCLKSKGKLSNLALGEDVEIQEVIQMSKTTLVGRVNGRYFAIGTISKWMEEVWSFLGYVPEVHELNRRWYAFLFRSEEQAQIILRKIWSINSSPMLLKPWSPMFDASREQVDVIPIWVRLPALPFQYWNEKYFRIIGNKLGEFLEADNSYLETRQRKVARILVNINVREGLGEELDLVLGPFCHSQKLDYENVPFRCRRCHKYGHLVVGCKLPLRVIKRKGSKEMTPQNSERQTPQKGCSMEPDEVRREVVIREASQPCGQLRQEAGGSLIKGRYSRKGSCMKWVHPTLPLAFLTGIPSVPRSFLSSLLQNLNLNLVSNRWMESLNAPLPSTNPLALKPLELEDTSQSVPPLAGRVFSERPLMTVKGNDQSGSLGSFGYFLGSKMVPNPVGGLGMEWPEGGSGRGRKSYISKAKNKVKSDLLAGKQQSIEGALRAARALDRGSQKNCLSIAGVWLAPSKDQRSKG